MSPTSHLHRQAHPKFMDGAQITSQVFIPFPKDDGLLSVYDGDQISAAEAHAHYTQVLGNESHSVWSLTKAEADGEAVPASADPLPDFPSHSKIDFTGKTDKECRKIAKKLKAWAMARGCQFLPA
ncbi:MAG: hypothetical protein IPK22_22235 [Verrucomicrobiaceae bacterium]|nr:hypothetical protein [Verrucomicrobiaceae bacterium]